MSKLVLRSPELEDKQGRSGGAIAATRLEPRPGEEPAVSAALLRRMRKSRNEDELPREALLDVPYGTRRFAASS